MQGNRSCLTCFGVAVLVLAMGYASGCSSSGSSGTRPAAPANLTATPGDASAVLQWSASSGAASYNVYRSTTSGTGYTKAGTTPSITSIVRGLTDGTRYYFVVTAVNGAGESGYSNEANAVPEPIPPQVPTNLTARLGNKQISLMWTTSAGATGYNIYESSIYGLSGSGYGYVTATTATGYTVTGLTNGAPYSFTVTAYNNNGESEGSNVATATPALVTGTFTVGKDPLSIAIDGSGNVWVVNGSGEGPYGFFGSLSELINASNYATINTYIIGSGPAGIAIDASGNVWVTNFGEAGLGNSVSEVTYASGYTSGKTFIIGPIATSPSGIAIDTSGNVWVTNAGYTISELTYPAYTTTSSFSAGHDPHHIAIDGSGNVWTTNIDGNTITALTSSGSVLTSVAGFNAPSGIAIDASGNVWVTNSGGDTVSEVTASSNFTLANTFTVGYAPAGVSVDVSGNVWVVNKFGNDSTKNSPGSITELASSGLSVATYTVGWRPAGIAIDASGNVWVTNNCGNDVSCTGNGALTEIVNTTRGPQYFPYSGPQFPGGGNW